MHRRDSFRAEKIMQERLFKNPKIEVVWNSVLDEVVGTDDPKTVTGVKLRERHDRRDLDAARSTACSSPSAMRRRPSCSRASSR